MGMNELHIKLILVYSLIFICDITLFQMNWVENKCGSKLKTPRIFEVQIQKVFVLKHICGIGF